MGRRNRMICPNCKHAFTDPARQKGGVNKAAKMTAEERSAEMSRIRKKGIKNRGKKKGVPRRPNDKLSHPDHAPDPR